ncbi:MAG: DUF2007 domain-containing protein [Acidobacteriota bacterium]
MQRVFTSHLGDNAEVGMLKEIIEKEGIECVVRNDSLTTALGGVPVTECYPELWVLNDEDLERARQFVEEWLHPRKAAMSWICASCGEKIEGQFANCWKCGKERESSQPNQ